MCSVQGMRDSCITVLSFLMQSIPVHMFKMLVSDVYLVRKRNVLSQAILHEINNNIHAITEFQIAKLIKIKHFLQDVLKGI